MEKRLAFEAYGSADARTVLFLHGGGVGGWMWRPVIKDLPEYRCLAPDQPEHGGSREVRPFSIELAARMVARLIREQAHRGKACVVGLSEGAQIAVQLLASDPEVVDKAVVSSALLRPVPGLGWAGSPALLAWTYRLSVRPFLRNDWWIRMNMKYAAGVPDAFYPQFKADFQQLTEPEFVNLMTANQRFRMPGGLAKALAATLVLAGRKEYAAMHQSARELAAALPNATGGLLNLGTCSSMAQEHNWALTAPALFARTVRAWLEGQTLPFEIEVWPRP